MRAERRVGVSLTMRGSRQVLRYGPDKLHKGLSAGLHLTTRDSRGRFGERPLLWLRELMRDGQETMGWGQRSSKIACGVLEMRPAVTQWPPKVALTAAPQARLGGCGYLASAQ